MSFWFDDAKRLNVAKQFQHLRLEYIQQVWSKDRDLQNEGFYIDDAETEQALKTFAEKLNLVQASMS